MEINGFDSSRNDASLLRFDYTEHVETPLGPDIGPLPRKISCVVHAVRTQHANSFKK